MSYVVTLVHGTWAGKREWTVEGSPLRTELEKRLGPIEFRTVHWSGGNWARDRLEAGARLRAALTTALRQRPDARHFVIAHSHGGNAVMYSLEDADLRRRIGGVVTLATPFLHVGIPQFNEDSAFDALKMTLRFSAGLLSVIAFILLLVAAGGLIEWLGITENTDLNSGWGNLALLLILLGMLAAFTALLHAPGRIGTVASQRLISRFDRLREELTVQCDPMPPVLILRTTGDEASGVLAISQLLSWLVGRVTLPLAWLADKIHFRGDEPKARSVFRGGGTWSRCLVAILVVSAWALNFWWASNYAPIVSVDFAFPAGTLCLSLFFGVMSLFFLLFVVWVTLLTAIAILLLVRAVTLILFGIDVALASVVLDITAEATPVGTRQLLHVPGRRKAPKGPLAGLAHSHIYNDDNALAAIACFLQDHGLVSSRAG